MALTMTERVAERAETVRPARALLSVLAALFYALGVAGAVVVVAASWAWAAVLVGFADTRDRAGKARGS